MWGTVTKSINLTIVETRAKRGISVLTFNR